jgi:hypothetical protein
MAARSASEVPRCGACNQAFRIAPRPEPLAVFAGANSPAEALPCPFCGFLNPAPPPPTAPPHRLTFVRPAEVKRPAVSIVPLPAERPRATRRPKICPFISVSDHQGVDSTSVTAA